MEGVLRSQEVFKVADEFKKPVVFFPIRHHSPSCSFHLGKVIEQYNPDCILIEGPENANHLIPILTNPDTIPPVAFYYSYHDSKSYVGKEKEDYKCYYPFLEYSPELEALKQAKEREIPALFIDLPYGQRLIGTQEGRGVRQDGEKQTYNDDYFLSRSRYIQELCQKTGLRDFEEFWEKYFEIQGIYIETEKFINQMLTYCHLARVNTPMEEMEADGCLLREQFMAQQIEAASMEYKRILVVTGGFHTSGLMERLEIKGQKITLVGEKADFRKIPEEDQAVYPMAYSMEAADALNGYASGMQSPGFYQKVWERIKEGRKEVYKDSLLEFFTKAGKQARKEQESLSAYDEICAFSMSQGLASLRGKSEPGLYELQDCALSCFVKGECNLSTDLPLRILKKLTTGNQIGVLCQNTDQPPLLRHFEQTCRNFGLKIHTTVEQQIILELFTKKKHLNISRFFYCLDFLQAGFARRSKGADLLNRRDRNRIREIWHYQWNSQVTAVLIDNSVSGGTMEEACLSIWKKQFLKAENCREAAKLMVSRFLMGLADEQIQMETHMEKVLAEDGNFFSLTGGCSHMIMLYELRDLYQIGDSLNLERMIKHCFHKVIQLLPSMAGVAKEQVKDCMDSCLTLYQMTGKKEFSNFRELLLNSFLSLLEKKDIRPGLEGAVMGLLYGSDHSFGEQISKVFSGYLSGTLEQSKKASEFLKGVFLSARDFVFVSGDFLHMIDQLLEQLPGDEFMELLPDFRMAFGYFTPMEINRIARKAAELHGKSSDTVLKGPMITAKEYDFGEMLDSYACHRMKEESE